MTDLNFLRVLIDPEDAQLDVVAVHGLNYTNRENHAEETWTASNGKMWLKDFLPKQLPDARILLFGYNANVAFDTSAVGTDGQAGDLLNRLWLLRHKDSEVKMDRPIMFICYQFGGIIVKRALFDAELDKAYVSIRNLCYGIVFFATPHRGGRFGMLEELASTSLENTFIGALTEDSRSADGLIKAFRHQLKARLVISFYETLPLERLEIVIVDRKSATLGLSGTREKQVPLDANHESLCRFDNFDGDDYTQVRGNIQELADSIKELATKREEAINEAKAKSDSDEKNRRDVLDYLCPSAFDRKHIEISGRRKKNTGEWFLEEPLFQKWTEKDLKYRLLWGYGIAGAGKTFISSFVIDHIQGQASEKNYGVAYIYFDYNERRQQTPINILSSLVKQLAGQLHELPTEIDDLYQKLKFELKTPTAADIYTTLTAVSKYFVQTFIICDALDECDPKTQRKELLQLFRQMEVDSVRIKLFLTSRENCEDIQCSLENSAKIRLYAKEKDIQTYIRQKIDEYPQAKRFLRQDNYESEVISQIIECAKGMFLLVHFYIELLYRQTTLSGFLNELGKLKPVADVEPLDQIYERAIANINKQTANRANLALTILSWLVKAQRTLTVNEMRVAVSVKQDQCKLHQLDLPDTKTLVDVCGSLVTLDKKSNTIRLTHYTVQEYLLRNSILPQDADFRLAMACCTYLTFDHFAGGSGFIPNYLTPPFLEYAVSYLRFHIKECDEPLSQDLVLKLLENPGNVNCYLKTLLIGLRLVKSAFFRTWLGLSEDDWKSGAMVGNMNIKTDMNVSKQLQLSLLAACILGHSLVVRSLLGGVNPVYLTGGNNCVSINSTSTFWLKSYGTPILNTLCLAVLLADKKLVGLLLEKGADISAFDNDRETLLHVLVYEDNKEAVELLLETGTDISAVDSNGDTALHIAMDRGDIGIVELLLDKGADTSAVNSQGDTVFHVAVNKRYIEFAKLLLDKGGDISVVNSQGDTVLHTAANRGDVGIFKLLLDKGADILAVNSNGDTVLHTATYFEHIGVIKALPERGADISAANSQGDTALHIAAKGGDIGIFKALLDKGADISAVNNNGDTILHMAAYFGHIEMIKVLLEKDADISAVNSLGRPALHMAANKGYVGAARLLLGKGADISAVNNHGDTALYEAVRNDNKVMLELLLERGADISATNSNGNTVLHEAVSTSPKEMIELLLERGANISVVNNNGDTVLHTAAYFGRIELTEFLLERGADISAVNNNGGTVLHMAAYVEHIGVIKTLLERGADISVADNHGDTVLHMAAYFGYKVLIELLLERGADISAVDRIGRTALLVHVSNPCASKEVIHLLLDKGADINAVDKYGRTALHITRSKEVIELLIQRGSFIHFPWVLKAFALEPFQIMKLAYSCCRYRFKPRMEITTGLVQNAPAHTTNDDTDL